MSTVILNVVMYVLYRVTSRQKTSNPTSLESKLKEIEKLNLELKEADLIKFTKSVAPN